MGAIRKIKIDDEVVYIKGLESVGGGYVADSISDLFAENSLQDALKPIVSLGQKIKKGLQSLEPDETELTLQLSVGIEGQKLFFALANTSAEAQISLKYVWRSSDQVEQA